ncbi:hypothetical protein KBB96_20490 [Luteolibacter ambystomatis]|uniref:Uncharacterized protein n=1 Tax=Luteolibacter ambystomatis TaxID=2824561 RepID=A0A975G8V3_9BACT|nr:hypothetical protein [Luteolibacter ambystomatis]QUE51219.1 hypothetical protein KBB96_20490 [Luteolibacter ambystomatis]
MFFVRRIFQFLRALRPEVPPCEAEWEDVTPAEWRAWEADRKFSFSLDRLGEDGVQRVVMTVLATAERVPDRTTVREQMRRLFGMRPPDAARAVDRVIGGVVRAGSGFECPDAGADPLAARAFMLAWRDRPLVPAIRARWGAWRPGGV